MSPVTIAALVREDPRLVGLSRYESIDQASLLPGLRRVSLTPKMRLPPMCLITRRSGGEQPMLEAFADCVRAEANTPTQIR